MGSPGSLPRTPTQAGCSLMQSKGLVKSTPRKFSEFETCFPLSLLVQTVSEFSAEAPSRIQHKQLQLLVFS